MIQFETSRLDDTFIPESGHATAHYFEILLYMEQSLAAAVVP